MRRLRRRIPRSTPTSSPSKCPFCGAAIVATADEQEADQAQGPPAVPHHPRNRPTDRLPHAGSSSLWFAPSTLARDGRALRHRRRLHPRLDLRHRHRHPLHRPARRRLLGHRDLHRTRCERQHRHPHPPGPQHALDAASAARSPTSSTTCSCWPAARCRPRSPTPRALGPENLVPYRDEYLSGFVAESYQVDLPQGFEVAKRHHGRLRSARPIAPRHRRRPPAHPLRRHPLPQHHLQAHAAARLDQRLPLPGATSSASWSTPARGEVQGERPYSVWKIVALVLAIIAIACAIGFFAQGH